MTISKPTRGSTGWDTQLDRVIDDVNTLAPHPTATDPHGDRAYAAAQDAVHVAASDPHADRAYAATLAATKAAAVHTHTGSDVTDLLTDVRYGYSTRVWPAATDTAIRAAAAALSPANGGTGGIVMLPAQTITLTSPLPTLEGIGYQGVEPKLIPSSTANLTYITDGEFTFGGGTVLQGDGTFAAFEANATDQGSVSATIGATQISSFSVCNVGLQGFTYGVHIGAVNIMGMVWGRLDKIYVRNCSVWGVKLVNFQHVDVGEIRTCLCANGQYYGALLPGATLLPGNSTFKELFHDVPQTGVLDKRLCRGIVFEAGGTGALLNELFVGRVQSNCFNRALLSDTVTFTSSSTSATVADGTKYAVGMPVVFTTTNFGFTLSRVYFVLSVSSNTLTFATSRTGSAVSATGSGSLTSQTYGFPNVELSSLNSGAKVQNSWFGQVDTEGPSTVAVYTENAVACTLRLYDIPATSLIDVAGRGTTFSEIHARQAAKSDFDSNSYQWWGTRGTIIQRPGQGHWFDNVNSVGVISVGQSAAAGVTTGDLQTRLNGFVYPAGGLGDKISTRDTAVTLAPSLMGDLVCSPTGSIALTLPTIVTDTAPNTSHIGLWFHIINTSAFTITLNTDGTQLFNKVAAKTSISITTLTSVKVIACKDNSGTLFWAALGVTALS